MEKTNNSDTNYLIDQIMTSNTHNPFNSKKSNTVVDTTHILEKIKNANCNESLINLQIEISKLMNQFISSNFGSFQLDLGVHGIAQYTPYDDCLSILAEKILTLNPRFKLSPVIHNTEHINGYQMYNCSGKFMCFSDFEKYRKIYEENDQLTYDEFNDIFQNTACTEWSKQDENGESYVGFWKAEEGSYEKTNAWNLTRDKNCKALYNLPYPKYLLIESIKFGCSKRLECVRFSNFFCEWVKRKIEIMND